MKKYLIVLMLVLMIMDAGAVSAIDDTYTGDDTYAGDDTKDQDGNYQRVPEKDNAGKDATKYKDLDDPVIIDSVDTAITVTEDNRYGVEKRVNVYYNAETGHEITMKIPLNNFKSSEKDTVEDISVASNVESTVFTSKTGKSSCDVVITDSVEGFVMADYTINYTYISRGDDDPAKDIFKHDLVGFGDVPVMKLKFSVSMPKAYNQNELLFKNGSGENIFFAYGVKDNKIEGTYDGMPEKGVMNMILSVENGYFKSMSPDNMLNTIWTPVFILCWLSIIAGIITASISYIKSGINPTPNVVSQTRPAFGISSPDAVILLKGGATTGDIMLFMIELANDGYVKIRDRGKGIKDPGERYEFIKIKDYDKNNQRMKQFMDIVFNNGKYISMRDIGNERKWSKLNNLRRAMQRHAISARWAFDEKLSAVCRLSGLFIPLLFSIIFSLYNTNVGLDFRILAFIYGPALAVAICIVVDKTDKRIKENDIMRGGVADVMTWIYVAIAVFISLIIIHAINSVMFVKSPISITMAYLAEFILIFTSCNLIKKTDGATIICGKMLGFKNYVLEANDIEMKRNILKDEQYVYKILPFVMGLGAYDETWLARMDKCRIDNPAWYESDVNDEFRLLEFVNNWNERFGGF